MLAFDDPAFSELTDPRTGRLIDLLSKNIYFEIEIATTLKSAGLEPGRYVLGPANVTWTTVVPDAAQSGKLGDLMKAVSKLRPAFTSELEKTVSQLTQPVAVGGNWYQHDDPYMSYFVGLRRSRAVIDRLGLRAALRELANDEYRVLLVYGKPRSGKTHTWLFVDHLRNAGRLVGNNRFALVTTHDWSDAVTGEAIAESLAGKLNLSINLAPSDELDEARVRKFLSFLVGAYPQDDGLIRWIILDGLDRPGVQDGARDLAKGLIRLVDRGELPQTRLVITGLDPLGLHLGNSVRTEKIPAIDKALLRKFLTDVATQLGRTTTDGELDGWIAEIAGSDPKPRDLGEVENSVVQLVKTRWVEAVGSE